jgi:hypothetical protein
MGNRNEYMRKVKSMRFEVLTVLRTYANSKDVISF